MEKDRTSYLLLFCCVTIWGLNFVAVKFLLAEISPINLILLRFIPASLLLLLLLFLREDAKVPLKDFYRLCLLGFIGITVYQFLFIYALKYSSVTNVAVIINTAPLYGSLLSSVFGYERFHKKTFYATVLGFIGVYIFISKGELLSLTGDLWGAVLALVGCFLWALYTIMAKPMLDKHSPLKVTAYTTLTGSALLCGFIPFYINIKEIKALSSIGWLSLIFSIVFAIVIAFVLWYRGISKIGASRTFIYQYCVPVLAAFAAFIILHEQLYWSQFIGAAIIFASITFSKRR